MKPTPPTLHAGNGYVKMSVISFQLFTHQTAQWYVVLSTLLSLYHACPNHMLSKEDPAL